MKLGEFIDIVCWYKHINQAELAKQLGVSAKVANTIVHNEYRMTPQVLLKLSEILEMPTEVLFMWQGLEIYNRKKEGDNV